MFFQTNTEDARTNKLLSMEANNASYIEGARAFAADRPISTTSCPMAAQGWRHARFSAPRHVRDFLNRAAA